MSGAVDAEGGTFRGEREAQAERRNRRDVAEELGNPLQRYTKGGPIQRGLSRTDEDAYRKISVQERDREHDKAEPP